MLLQHQIEKEMHDAINARADKNTILLLKGLVADFGRRKNLKQDMEDKDVIKVIKEHIAGSEEMLRISNSNLSLGIHRDKHMFNIQFLRKYLPNRATDEEVIAYILKEHPEAKELSPQQRNKLMGGITKAFANRMEGGRIRELLMGL